MKKLLGLLTITAVVSAPISSMVSCAEKFNNDIYVLTDAGKVTDNSFNESVYDGANFFIKNGLGDSKKAAYSEPAHNDTNTLNEAYQNIANNIKPKAVVLSGYIHTASFGGNNAYDKIFSDAKISVVQTDAPTPGASTVGIRFYKDSAGFVAGFESIIWAIENGKTTGDTLNLATYGGQINGSQFAVTNYMTGFEAAIDFFNGMKAGTDGYAKAKTAFTDGIKNEKVTKWLDSASTTIVQRTPLQKDGPTKDDDANWNSGDYEAGHGKSISSTLINDGANIVFPVAGPQTADTLGVIAQTPGKNVNIIGVDTDMSKVYSSFKDKIITSATIPLTQGTAIGLAHTDAYIDNKDAMAAAIKGLKENDVEVSADKADEANKDNYNQDDNKTKWQGHNVWLSGTTTKGDSSLLDPKEEQFISTKFFNAEKVQEGSKKFVAKGDQASYTLLAPGFTKSYADAIAKTFAK